MDSRVIEDLYAALALLPPLERARVTHRLLLDERARLAAIRRAAIAEEVEARGRGGVNQVAVEMGLSRQKVGEAVAEHRRR